MNQNCRISQLVILTYTIKYSSSTKAYNKYYEIVYLNVDTAVNVNKKIPISSTAAITQSSTRTLQPSSNILHLASHQHFFHHDNKNVTHSIISNTVTGFNCCYITVFIFWSPKIRTFLVYSTSKCLNRRQYVINWP